MDIIDSVFSGNMVDLYVYSSPPTSQVSGYPKLITQLFPGQPSPIDAADADNMYADRVFTMYLFKSHTVYEYSADNTGNLVIAYIRIYSVDDAASPFAGMPPGFTAVFYSQEQNKIYAFVGAEMYSKVTSPTAPWQFMGLAKCL